MVAKKHGEETRLTDLHQKGSLKTLFPQPLGNTLDMVCLNTAGGVTGGDSFTYHIQALENAGICISSQAAERAYKSHPDQTGTIKVNLQIGSGARIDWLPQETILFNRASIQRCMEVELSKNARALMVEPVVFGRTAMGERITQLEFSDQWRIKRDGALVFADATKISGDAEAIMRNPATGDRAGAMASMIYASADAERFLGKLKSMLPLTAGVSLVRDDILVVRALAPNSFELRRMLIPTIQLLTETPIPKVWTL